MTSEAKAQLRAKVLAGRPQSSEGFSENLKDLVNGLQVGKVASYSPMNDEPDVSEFNAWLEGQGRLLLPRIIGETLVFASGALAKGPMGLWEPSGEAEMPELLIVPALAVDLVGNRLGRGKGFYDRVLAGIGIAAYAVVFESEVFESLPTEPHDEKLSGFVTPIRTMRFD